MNPVFLTYYPKYVFVISKMISKFVTNVDEIYSNQIRSFLQLWQENIPLLIFLPLSRVCIANTTKVCLIPETQRLSTTNQNESLSLYVQNRLHNAKRVI